MGNKRGKRKNRRYVDVYLDGEKLIVPARVYSDGAARLALMLPPTIDVAYEIDAMRALMFCGGHVFRAGDRYVTCPPGVTAEVVDNGVDYGNEEEEEDEEDLQQPWERDPDFWKSGS